MGVITSSDCTSFTGWTRVPENNYPLIDSGFICSAHQSAASWNTVGEYQTTPQTVQSGYIFYGIKNTNVLDAGQAEFHLLRDTAGIDFGTTGTIRAGIIWNFDSGNHYVGVWDTSSGTIPATTYAGGTNYEFKGTINSDGTVTFKYRAVGAGSWTSIGSTTLGNTPSLIGQSIYFAENAYGLGSLYYLKAFQLSTAPSVDAGGDQSVRLGTTVNLAATVVLGVPTATTTWTKVSGPGTATFGSASSTSTTVTLSAVGNYVLRMTLTDGDFTVTDDVAILVVGSLEDITKHDNFLTDSGFFTDITSGGTVTRSGGKKIFTPSGSAWDVCGTWLSIGTAQTGMRCYFDFYDPATNGNFIITFRSSNGITKAVGVGVNLGSGVSKAVCWEGNANTCTGLPVTLPRGNGMHSIYGEIQSNGTIKFYYSGPNLSTSTELFTSSGTTYGSGTIYVGFNNFNQNNSIGNVTVTIPLVVSGGAAASGSDELLLLGDDIYE